MSTAPLHADAVVELIRLTTPDAELADTLVAAFHEDLAAASGEEDADEASPADEGDEPNVDEDENEDQEERGHTLMWIVKETTDWESSFYVDWKDTESFVAAVEQIAEPWNATVDWGVPDATAEGFLESHGVPDLMAIAHGSLASQGLTLWNWDTRSDCYSGWIARAADDARMRDLSALLAVEFRPGSQSF